MNLAALDRRMGAEGATDDFAQRLGAVDDEQSADLGIKPALDQVVDKRLHNGGVLSCSFDQGERMFVAFSINAEGSERAGQYYCDAAEADDLGREKWICNALQRE
jgi:hypothetical protein